MREFLLEISEKEWGKARFSLTTRPPRLASSPKKPSHPGKLPP